MKNTPWFLHVDLDAFFASVEQLDHPEYRGKPVIVGGLPEDRRSVVSTASYEARKFGVHSAMPTFKAYKLCPQGIYVRGNMRRYSELSWQIMSIFREYSPDVLQMSIDEAFIDLTGTEKLFGPPEETAMKIKAHVKKATGLTVSIGLATTKYLAKIASGLSKPDGFYFIKPGTEQEFMLNLPLSKIWGIGDKGQENLKKNGIRTTRDIYEKTYDSLEFMFGKNMAHFLYNVVRGIDTVGFGNEAKKHSISAETTFAFDVTDIYTAETKLLELCHGIIFRLIRQNQFSRTAFVKIRYNDFSTVSIQETTDRSILTVDSFFEIVKQLFEKKYENGRGIRLLGVGLDNIEKEDKPYQQDLFESSDEKKQAVEKAILKLEKKHPEIKVHKARMLNKTKLLIFALFSALLIRPAAKLSAEEVIETENIDYILSGYWQGMFKDTFNLSFGNNTPFLGSFSTPVFTQEIDLSAWILLNKKWYFEADFADNFDKNTVALGYKGNGYLKTARLSNRGITIPDLYSANVFGFGLTGGNNQAPGLSLHFSDISDSIWSGDFVVRYDMTKTNSATFYGKNSVTDVIFEPEDFLYGKYFILPPEACSELSNIKDIYVENKTGKYKDSNGKKYKKLTPSDYIVIPNTGKIIFANNCGTQKQDGKIPTILITFLSPQSISNIIDATGNYLNPETFAGKIQSYFNTYTNQTLNLQDYSYNLEIEVENEKALVLQNSILFSPYLCANIYDCGLSSLADVFVKNASSDKISQDYLVETLEKDISELTNDFIFENHLYVQVQNNNYNNNSLQTPETRYPFADISPQTYLNLPSDSNLQLVVRNYSQVSNFQIESEAIEGTVQVYINGILDTQASYNPETKIVELSHEVSDTDKIYIVWQEDSSNFAGGALVAGSGLFVNLTPNLSMDFAITSRLPVTIKDHYSTPDNPLSGFAAFSSGVNYNNKGFTLAQKSAVSVNTDNVTGKLLVLEQTDSELETYYLSNSDGFITKTEPYISSSDFTLLSDKNKTVLNHAGVTDKTISGYKIPLSWDFSEVSVDQAISSKNSGSPYWACVDVKLANGYLLKKASNVQIALQHVLSQEDFQNYRVFIQLGVNASEDDNGEDTHSLPVWEITDQLNGNSTWQIVNLSITDEQKARIVSNNDARLIIVYSPEQAFENFIPKGTVFFGPYEPLLKSMFTAQNQFINVDAYPDSKATRISWQVTDKTLATVQSQIKAFSYFTQADFNSYKSINLDFAISEIGPFTIALKDSNDTALELNFNSLPDFVSIISSDELLPEYHKLSIDPITKEVFIDGQIVDSSFYDLFINYSVIPEQIEISIDTLKNQEIIEKGIAYIGNLYYTDATPYGQVQNYFYAKYEQNKNYIELSSKQAFTTNQTLPEINATAAGAYSIGQVRLEGDFTTSKIAGHFVHTEKPLFNFLSFEENYRFNSKDKALNKKDGISFDFSNPVVPVKLSFETSAKEQNNNRNQTSKGQGNITLNIGKTSIGLGTNASYSQKLNTDKEKIENFNTDNYFKGWYDISTMQFSTGNEHSSVRTQTYAANLYTKLPFISLKPELKYELQSLYQNLSETTVDDITTLSFAIPFSLTKNSFAFEIKRTGSGRNTITAGGNYFSDAEYIAQSFYKRSWLYTTIPFYDLFQKNLYTKITDKTLDDEIASYNTIYELLWKRRMLNTYYDLLIPSSTALSFSREIKGGIAQSDVYQIKCVITNTALNCFGKQSTLKLFDWYNQDEFISNITGAIQFPYKFTLSAFEQILFYLDNDATIKSGFDVLFEANETWSTRANVIWERPGSSSIIVDLAGKISEKISEIPFSIKRKEAFNLTLGRSNETFAQKYEYTHGTEVTFKQNYSITAEMGTILLKSQDAAFNAGLTLSLGAKLTF